MTGRWSAGCSSSSVANRKPNSPGIFINSCFSTKKQLNILTTDSMMPDSNVHHSAHWQELDEWRKKIDAIDRQLSTLLCERLHCAENISSLKSQIGEEVLQPEREKEVLNNVLNHTDSPLKSHALEKIYRCIIEETRMFQHEWKSSQSNLHSR